MLDSIANVGDAMTSTDITWCMTLDFLLSFNIFLDIIPYQMIYQLTVVDPAPPPSFKRNVRMIQNLTIYRKT